MHLVVLRLALFFTTLFRTSDGKNIPANDVALKEDLDLTPNWPEGIHQYYQGHANPTERAFTYRRKAEPSQAKSRLLFVDYAGMTWTYSPRTASWTTLSQIAEFDRLSGNSITSLCETRAVAFGGSRHISDSIETTFHTTTLMIFDGESEEWVRQNLENGPQGRDYHKAFTRYEEKSPCQCKESLYIYGGTSLFYTENTDFWELRCVDDKSLQYEWIKINASSWPLNTFVDRYAFSVNEDQIYWLTHNSQTAWIFDVTNETWASKTIDSACPNYENVTFLYQEGIVYVKEYGLLIFQLDDELLGVYNVTGNLFQCVSVEFGGDLCRDETVPAKFLLLDDQIVFVSLLKQLSVQVKLWKLQIDKLLQILKTDSIAVFEEIHYTNKYPVSYDDLDASLVRVSDTTWYLVLEEDQEVNMWLFEKDFRRWTLYDLDHMPGTRKTNARLATQDHQYVVFYGTSRSYSSSDDLWVYSINKRIWTKVRSLGNAPTQLTSYATMDAIENGSLLLFGGVDNELNSLWMVAVDFNRMEATWERICCDVQQGPAVLKLQQWSSTVWNNTLFVYFAKTNSSCNWTTYYAKLGMNEITWNSRNTSIDPELLHFHVNDPLENVCSRPSTAMGRFALTTSKFGYFLIEDLSEMNLEMVKEHELPFAFFNTKFLQAGSGNTVFTFIVTEIENKTEVPSFVDFKFPGCKPGTNSSNYVQYPCRLCPKGQYSDHYGARNCTGCPTGLVTSSAGSTSFKNCTCARDRCAHGECILQSDYTSVCICYFGFTGQSCETPTTYLIGMGVVVALLLIAAFLYCTKRIKKHQSVARYTRFELEMAEKTVAQLCDIWSVDKEEIEFEKLIGKGSFGDVWAAQYRDQTVAVKVLKIKDEDCTDKQLEEFKDESELLRSIFHANIVRFIGTGKTTENKPLIVLEYMERGSVRQELDDKYGDHPMDIALQVKYALHAAKGMRHLHRINRMHRDLKCDNLLVNNAGIVKVADLGCTKIAPKISEDDDSGSARGSRAVGTAFFRAPEILRGEEYGVAVDVYSYGITLWEIMTAKYPYVEKYEKGLLGQEIIDKIAHSDLRPEFPDDCGQNLKKLAIWCWNGNPCERPTFEEIVPVLKGL